MFLYLCDWDRKLRTQQAGGEQFGLSKLRGGSLRSCMPAVMYVELDIQVQSFVVVCGFIDGSSRFALNDDWGKHFYYPAINKLVQSITADLDSAADVECFFASLFWLLWWLLWVDVHWWLWVITVTTNFFHVELHFKCSLETFLIFSFCNKMFSWIPW